MATKMKIGIGKKIGNALKSAAPAFGVSILKKKKTDPRGLYNKIKTSVAIPKGRITPIYKPGDQITKQQVDMRNQQNKKKAPSMMRRVYRTIPGTGK